MPRLVLIAAIMLPLLGGVAQAQIPGLPNGAPKLPGGLSGLAGGLPDLSSMSAGNAAGVLGYCLKNKLLGGGDASSVLSGLAKQPGVAASPDFKTGQSGNIATGSGPNLSLGGLQSQMKTKACDLVLKNAKHLL